MFFLRCAFFLSIVYSSMSWTNGALQPQRPGAPAVATVPAATSRLVSQAVAGARDLCARHAQDCLADAARLTALFSATDASEPAKADAGRDRPRPSVATPRRHGRDTKLASAP